MTTSTPKTTTTMKTKKSPLMRSKDYIRRPSPEFLLYIKQVEEQKMKKKMEQLLKKQEEHSLVEEEHEEENTIILAIIISILGCICMIIFSIAIIIYQKSSQSNSAEKDTDVESTTSTYLQYSTNGSDCGYIANYDTKQQESQYQTLDSVNVFLSAFGEKHNYVPYSTSFRYQDENDYVDVDSILRH